MNGIIVATAPRSGSSMVTSILEACGGFLGHPTKGALKENETIDKMMEQYTRGILGAPPRGRVGEASPLLQVDDLPPSPDISLEMRMQGWKGDTPWVLKIGGTALVHRAVIRDNPNVKWILLFRDVGSIVASAKSLGMPEWANAAHVGVRQGLLRGVMDHTEHYRSLWTPHIAQGRLEQLRQTVRWAGLEWDEDAVQKIIDPTKWHHQP